MRAGGLFLFPFFGGFSFSFCWIFLSLFWWFTHLFSSAHGQIIPDLDSPPGVSLLCCEPGLGLGEPTTYQVKVANYVIYSIFLAVFGMFRTMISYHAVFGAFSLATL